jgi:hypothetical protein
MTGVGRQSGHAWNVVERSDQQEPAIAPLRREVSSERQVRIFGSARDAPEQPPRSPSPVQHPSAPIGTSAWPRFGHAF